MQNISSETLQTIEQSVAMEIYSMVVGEWEMNAFHTPTVTAPPSVDEELFPKDSLAEPRRPVRSGTPKLIVNQARFANKLGSSRKYRIASDEANYRYFQSEQTSDSLGDIGPLQFTLEYPVDIDINKIVVGFEDSFASPLEAEVLIRAGGLWSSIGVFPLATGGLIEVYLQDDDSWSTIMNRSNQATVDGVRVVVSSMVEQSASLAVIQISPRISLDFTDRVIEVARDSTREDVGLTNPIGSAASSTADIQLSNHDGLFSDPESPISGMIDSNVMFKVFTIVVNDSSSEGIPAGTYFSDNWSDKDGVVNVRATCRSKFLQETIIEKSFYWNMTAGRIVADIIERFAHPDYEIRYHPDDANRVIPYVFFSDEATIWDALAELATAEQAAFYFDEQDRFVWESRDYVWQNDSPVWELRDEASGLNLPNLVDFNEEFEVGANKVTVSYTPLAPARSAGGQEVNNVLWERSEELFLSASQLMQDITLSSQYIHIQTADWPFFPREGFVNVDGEYIGFKKGEVTGRLDIVARGLFGSTPRTHNRNPISNFWSFFNLRWNGSNSVKLNGNGAYGRHRVTGSTVEITSSTSNWRDLSHYMGGSIGDRYAVYGTEFFFPVSVRIDGTPFYDGRGVGGLFINHDGTGNGYYFEIMTSQLARTLEPQRAEFRAWRLNPSSGSFRYGLTPFSVSGGGPELDILPGRRYRLEVFYNPDNHSFVVYLDGIIIRTFVDTRGGTKRTSGYWGVFARDESTVRFESAWAVNRRNRFTDIPLAMNTIRERAYGGFNSGFLEDQWSSYNRRFSDVVFEDFGPWVHQGQEFDVEHEISPSVSADLFVSNDQDTFKVFHKKDAFSSHFALVNRSRQGAVVVGQDPSRDNQSMSLFVYGKPIIESPDEKVTFKDDASIRLRGREEMEVGSGWIQTKERAERIGEWIVNRWGAPNDVVSADVFANPALQLGDMVSVSSPVDHRSPLEHRYHVIGINLRVSSSTSMTLRLRRAR